MDLIDSNWLARKLYLIRKIWLTKYFFIHYSQFAEDVNTYLHLAGIRNGFFVDVGCFHPIKYNNTYRWYKLGWRGVNIDLDALKIEAFRMARPADENVVYAISKSGNGELRNCYSFGRYSLINTLDEGFAERYRAEGKQSRVRQVPVATLDYVLDRTRFAGRKIDLLNVDAEGHDLEVLQSLNFERYSPFIILVEFHARNVHEILESELFGFLSNKNYELVNWNGPTLMFKRKHQDLPA